MHFYEKMKEVFIAARKAFEENLEAERKLQEEQANASEVVQVGEIAKGEESV